MTNFTEPYNPDWKTAFENLKEILYTGLKDFDIDIQHVGSTSVSGLCAKPILDIDIIAGNKLQLNGISAGLQKMGYINKGEQGIPGRFAFRQSSYLTPATEECIKHQAHHLYVCFSDSLALKNHLLFRDSLLKDKELVRRYAQLKMDLINEKGITREEYTRRKTEFIIAVLSLSGLTEKELSEIKNANT
jgi:GrpB-like predicted nucleotidyltransferase (UPF0157 family)